jgi:regulator of protease activity HflC (stomatin/prohibitin superfamily)
MDENSGSIRFFLIAAAIVLIAWLLRKVQKTAASSTTIIKEGERGLVYRHGRFEREAGPGQHWMMFGRTMTRVPVNELNLMIANQEVMSADRMAVKLSALVIYKVIDARKAMEKSNGGYYQPLHYAAQLALRDVVAELPLETLVDTRTKLDATFSERAKPTFTAHGCELISMSVRDLILPPDVRRLATDVTRAKFEAAAALERARGEQASLRLLANAARLIKGNPELMNLRVLQALSSGNSKTAPTIILGGTTGIVPVPGGASEAADEAGV